MRETWTMAITALVVVFAACDSHAQNGSGPQTNPLLVDSELPYGMPPFDRIADEHWAPALEAAMAEERAQIETIAANPEPPTFDNTIVALEQSGQALRRVQRAFSNIVGAHTNDVLQAVQREMSPKLAAHSDEIFLDAPLFTRIAALHERRDALELDAESKRLLERYHMDFVRAGARLDAAQQERLREINQRLASLGTEFTQRVLAEVNDSAVVVDDVSRLAGLSDAQIRAAADEARERGLDGKWVIALVNTSGQPPLAELEDRALREQIHRASLIRNSRGNEHDTREIIAEIVRLRAERARMLGYATHAEYVIAEQTAPSVGAVNEMLGDLGPIAVANARKEAADIQRIIDSTETERFELQPWDWAFYAEKVRREQYDFEESEVRPYFELQNVLENGVFYSATRLFGITFERRDDLPTYHPDVQVWEVFEEDGTPLGLMLGDFYARASKRGGAWMNSYSIQSHLLGGQPVVGNHLNITKPPAGEPALMTWDQVRTLFHEFGHVLHGLFSNVTYPRFAATAVPRDFVEYPSQVYEMWASWPEVLENYARHHETGERIPDELLGRVLGAAEEFNQGFRTTEYLAASITDQALHQLPPDQVPSADELMAFEEKVLRETGMYFEPVPPRYRYPYFSHLFTHAYSAAYYSYIWSEVLDADSVQWFQEHGGFTRENGQHYRDHILSRGGSAEAMDLYRAFAGRDPEIEHLLRKRGLLVE